MNKSSGSILVIAVSALVLISASRNSNAQQRQTEMAGKTAAQAYKNIQILKDIPADQLVPSMQFISASLGVGCDFCHVEHAFEKDDKKEKRTAREMMTMMFAINKNNFEGHREVTCYSCHHGSHDVMGTPMIAEETSASDHSRENNAAETAHNANPPSADQVIDKFLQALGGVAALDKVNSRVESGHIEFDGHQVPIEVYAKSPDKRLSVVHMPNGNSTTAFDGKQGWLGNGGRPPREMNTAENAGANIDAELNFPQNLKHMFDQLRVSRPEKIGDKQETVVVGRKQGQPPVKLYFDPQTGLLTRAVRYTETPLGRLPVQIDYSDYREVGGIKTPAQWTLARTSGRFTIHIDEIKEEPIADSKFEAPAASSSGNGKSR
jgi:photosynthetic reaction center cytochrome c subunit